MFHLIRGWKHKCPIQAHTKWHWNGLNIKNVMKLLKLLLTVIVKQPVHPPPAWCERVQLCGEQQRLHPLPPGPAPHGESINHLSSIPHLVSCYWSACQCQPPCTLYRGDHQIFACDTKLCHVIYRPRFAHCRFCTKCHLWLFSRECALSKRGCQNKNGHFTVRLTPMVDPRPYNQLYVIFLFLHLIIYVFNKKVIFIQLLESESPIPPNCCYSVTRWSDRGIGEA